jgi:predicted aspartyl protease
MYKLDENGRSSFSRGPHTIIKFELRGHLPIVETVISGKTYKMAIDSGAASNSLDRGIFTGLENAAYRDLENAEVVGADQNKVATKRFILRSLSIGGVEFTDVRTTIGDLARLNSQNTQIKIDGILGYEILSRNVFSLNFKTRQMKLYR